MGIPFHKPSDTWRKCFTTHWYFENVGENGVSKI